MAAACAAVIAWRKAANVTTAPGDSIAPEATRNALEKEEEKNQPKQSRDLAMAMERRTTQ